MRRYDLENYEDSLSIMDVAPDGDWVDYDDAIEAIAEARQVAAREILELLSVLGDEKANHPALWDLLSIAACRISDKFKLEVSDGKDR